jgi:rhodanese-related sulfurtransferase
LEILDLLAQGPRHVDALAAETESPVANVSQHLQVLRNARLVESEREGTRTIYRLAGDDVRHLWLTLRSVAESRLAEVPRIVEQFAVKGAEGATLARRDVEKLMKKGEAVLLDVRPAVEYQAGHVAGSLSIPLSELPNRMGELPKGKHIVTYCRGSYCLFADEAVALLRRHGFKVARMEGGWPEWADQH